MAVPRMSQLHAGIGVNIVMKADQRSGNITTGEIADILTKGDHPRGIKVRLTDGQIGRVQSILSPTAATPSGSSASPSPALSYGKAGAPQDQNLRATTGPSGGRWGMVQDVRGDGYDAESRDESNSLFDYVRPSRKRKPAAKTQPNDSEGQSQPQTHLEAEFPKLDSALIAAILADYPSIDDARDVLKGLS